MMPPDWWMLLKWDQSSDAELMGAVRAGQMPALGELVARHQQRVRALAYRITGHWDVADEVTQDAFLRVHRSAGSYSPSAAFSTWLYRIVVNLCLDRAKRPRMAPLDRFEPQSAPADAPLIERERAESIRQAVAELPERQRIALALHRFENQSHAQIAAATGWSESAVESLLVRAYAQLRRTLALWSD